MFTKPKIQWDLLYLFALSTFFCLFDLGRGSLASWDEALYAVASRDMFLTKDWIRLTFFGEPFYDKPPLYFWLTSISYHFFGINELAARLPSALCGVGTVWATYFLGRRLFSSDIGFLAAGVLLSCSDFLHYSRFATLDVTNLFFFTSALCFYFYAIHKKFLWVFFWVCAGLAVLTKGPLIILACGLILLDSVVRKDFSYFKSKFFWCGLALFIILVLPWHILAYQNNPKLFMNDFILKHYVHRTQTAVEGHTGSWYFYIRTLINKCRPWFFVFVASLIWTIVLLIRKRKLSKEHGFVLAWAALVFGFFTLLVKTKLAWYILLMHPALALMIALFIYAILTNKKPVTWFKFIFLIILISHFFYSRLLKHDYAPELKSLSSYVKQSIPKDQLVFLYEYHDQPAAIFYLERKIAYIDSLAEFEERKTKFPILYILIPADKGAVVYQRFLDSGLKLKHRTQNFKNDLLLYSNA